ncbi:hypothetical protein [Azospirillum sp. TSO22-1]|uniref:hypothetical protein n=1 Tax=Azospirillum sp. TSO22-1 TaxID=716789 RepID=UPI0011B7B68F|nr:hypothetical protein [Azospirillum sp. TSO22-1]
MATIGTFTRDGDGYAGLEFDDSQSLRVYGVQSHRCLAILLLYKRNARYKVQMNAMGIYLFAHSFSCEIL